MQLCTISDIKKSQAALEGNSKGNPEWFPLISAWRTHAAVTRISTLFVVVMFH